MTSQPPKQHPFKSHRVNAGEYTAQYRYYDIVLRSPSSSIWDGSYRSGVCIKALTPRFVRKRDLINHIKRKIDTILDGPPIPTPDVTIDNEGTPSPTMDSVRKDILAELADKFPIVGEEGGWGEIKGFKFKNAYLFSGHGIVFKNHNGKRKAFDLNSGVVSFGTHDSFTSMNSWFVNSVPPGGVYDTRINVQERYQMAINKFEDLTTGKPTRKEVVEPLVMEPTTPSVDPIMGPLIDALTAAVDPKIDEKLRVFDKKFEGELADAKDRLADELKKSVARLSKPTLISFDRGDGSEPTPPKISHKKLPTLLKVIESGVNPMVVGPAGGGKTTAAKQVAEMLGLPLYFSGAMSGLHQLNGYEDANGVYHETQTYKAFKNGGVLLLDELDAGHAEVLVGTNMLSENGMHDFPVGRVDKHKDFILIAGANTYGRGADRMYVGRNQLDAATLDRYAIINWDYDEELERVLAGNDLITDEVQRLRKGCAKSKIRHVISPRASIYGARLYSKGFKLGEIMDMVVFKGLDEDQVKKIKNAA